MRSKNEAGAGLVEMAIVMPILVLFLCGIVDFGMTMNDLNSLRQGVRDGARQGAVANFGSTTSCDLTGLTGTPSTNVQRLMCLTKSQIGGGNDVRIAIKFTNAGLSAPSSSFTTGNGLIVCAARKGDSRTGFFTPILDSRDMTAINVFRIEQNSTFVERAGSEADPSGRNWSWCNL